MTTKAQQEIYISDPYFRLLGDKRVKNNLRLLLTKQAPQQFFSVLTQAVRHLLNGTFCSQNPNFCKKYENSLYLIALPTTSKKDKQKIIQSENTEFIFELYSSLKVALEK